MRSWTLVVLVAVAACGSPAASSSSSTPSPPASVTPQSPLPATGAPCLTAPAAASVAATTHEEWTTYMGDSARTGRGPAAPAAQGAHCAWTAHVDGDVYAEPLVTGTSVIVATEHDTVYALDAAGGAARWQRHLGEPVPLAQLECGDIDPNGITSTPVVDTANGLVYAVAMLGAPIRHELFALRLGDGSVAWHRVVDPPGADPRFHQQRSSLNLAGGRVHLAFGGFTGDCGTYHGWVISAPAGAAGTGALQMWQVPSGNEAAIWAPPGPVIDGNGSVFVSTGNSAAGPQDTNDDGNAVIRLDAQLAHPDAWWPKNWATLNSSDTDIGSMSPALVAGGLVFISGKQGIGYLMRAAHLGGEGGEVFKAVVCPDGGPAAGAFGGAAVAGDMVYVPCVNGITALRVNAGKRSFTVLWRTGGRAQSPVLAYGLLWTVSATVTGRAWTGTLLGIDPTSGVIRVQQGLGPTPHFPSPAAANGTLYVAGLGTVYAVSMG